MIGLVKGHGVGAGGVESQEWRINPKRFSLRSGKLLQSPELPKLPRDPLEVRGVFLLVLSISL